MRRSPLAALLMAGTAWTPAAFAQQEPQSTLTATISERFEYDSNYQLDDPSAGDTYFADTIFAMDYLQETEDRILGLGFDVGLRALWEADEDFDWQVASPSGAYLLYEDEGPHLAFDADVSARTRQVENDDDDIEDDIDDTLENLGDAREIRYDADVGFEIGPDAPMSYGMRFLGTDIDYDDNEGNLTPRQTVEGQAFLTARINPVLSAALFGSYFRYSADNNAETEVDIAEGDIGIIYEPSEVLEITAGVGYADREREDFGEQTESDSGIVLRGNVNYILPDFTINADGRYTTAAPDPRFSFNLRTNYALQRSQLFARVYNRYTGAASGGANEVRVTGAAFGVVHEINDISRVRLDLGYAHQENLDDDDDPDIDRTNLTASYFHDLTERITAEVGYGYTRRQDDPDDATSHRLFVEIGRTFETGL